MAKNRSQATIGAPASSQETRKPFHESIIMELEEASTNGDYNAIIVLSRLVNRTTVPSEHLLPLVKKLRDLADRSPIRPPLKDAANRLEAEHQRLIQ